MTLSRRHWLRAAGAVTLGFTGLRQLLHGGPAYAAALGSEARGFGPLKPDPAGIVDLPEGFSYGVFSKWGEKMDDGLFVPGKHDGMAAFPGPDGRTILIRNHEVHNHGNEFGAFGNKNELAAKLDPAKLYDAGRNGKGPWRGGTTTLVYDTKARKLESHFLSLAGTKYNCAGGPTPWGSWISCEEVVERAGEQCAVDHGYNFEVPATVKPGLVDPLPLKAMGRFKHEAVAVDPDTGIVYQTEDEHDSLIYRFIPTRRGELKAGGKLQAMAVIDRPSLDTRNWPGGGGEHAGPTIGVGDVLPVRWIDLEQIDNPENDLRLRGFAAGAALFARGEGMWYGRRSVFFACTNGGRRKLGQIWRYVPSKLEGTADEARFPGRLQLFIEPNDGSLIENADNLTVAPWGDLFVCEDGKPDQFVVIVKPDGRLFHFARNAGSRYEFAGACFSPDGSTLFVNIQGDGLTLAITGPWPA